MSASKQTCQSHGEHVPEQVAQCHGRSRERKVFALGKPDVAKRLPYAYIFARRVGIRSAQPMKEHKICATSLQEHTNTCSKVS